MGFFAAIQACFTKYATFEGRAGRSEYWWFWLFCMLVEIGLAVASSTLSIIFELAIILPMTAARVRRIHDGGRSGWFLLLPIVNLVWFCQRGTIGPNRFGPDPYAADPLAP